MEKNHINFIMLTNLLKLTEVMDSLEKELRLHSFFLQNIGEFLNESKDIDEDKVKQHLLQAPAPPHTTNPDGSDADKISITIAVEHKKKLRSNEAMEQFNTLHSALEHYSSLSLLHEKVTVDFPRNALVREMFYATAAAADNFSSEIS